MLLTFGFLLFVERMIDPPGADDQDDLDAESDDLRQCFEKCFHPLDLR
jgi:hypothetical protein